jgi:DegV family protein with EDD domain
MKIVIDSGADLSPEFIKAYDIHQVPLKVTLAGKTYLSGVDLNPEQFYDLIESTEELPITATPSVGDFVQIYEKLAAEDPDILSIHISSGLSGTYNTAVAAAGMVENANITVVDSLNLSAGYGWQVEAAARAIKAGWTKDQILKLLKQVGKSTSALFTLPDLKYLIAGGRIGHLKGLLASLLGIKPILTVSKEDGKYYDRGKKRSFTKAVEAIPEIVLQSIPKGSRVRAQICHAGNLEGSQRLVAALDKVFKCEWLQPCSIGPALGAHTGRGLIGVMFAAVADYPSLP